MKSMGEQCPFAQQPLVTRAKFDFGDRKCVTQVKRAVHVGVWEVPKPLGVFLLDLCGRQSSQQIWGGGVDVEDLIVFPFLLVSFFKVYQEVALARLQRDKLDDDLREMEMRVRTWANSIVCAVAEEAIVLILERGGIYLQERDLERNVARMIAG